MGKKILATLAFWATLLFGPAVLVLWNALSFMAMRPGELLYLVFAVGLQAAAATAACAWAKHILRDEVGNNVVRNNSFVAVLLFAFLVGTGFMSGASWIDQSSNILSIAALVAFGVLGKTI